MTPVGFDVALTGVTLGFKQMVFGLEILQRSQLPTLDRLKPALQVCSVSDILMVVVLEWPIHVVTGRAFCHHGLDRTLLPWSAVGSHG